ncbi:MAG: iron-regulated protein [Chitinophagaceae bacterium]|nr:MAG: iron-regulated protein [Chitinophagaceae bacterium]
MLVKKWILLSILFSTKMLMAQNVSAYKIYNDKGKAQSFEKMMKQLASYDMVLVGEYHNNSIVHWLELNIAKHLYASSKKKIMIGAEMYERDNQEALNKYLQNKIDEKGLGTEARLWKNHTTDYLPILNFAKDKKIPFIATNIPRKYASIVAKKGVDSLILTDTEKPWVVKLPFEVSLETPGYQEMFKMMGDHAGTQAMNFVSAQAIKDATMAESILKYWQPGNVFIHFHGDFHSKQFGGIYWYLKKANPNLKVAVISLAESDDIHLPLPKDFIKTNFNIVIPSDMTKTY